MHCHSCYKYSQRHPAWSFLRWQAPAWHVASEACESDLDMLLALKVGARQQRLEVDHTSQIKTVTLVLEQSPLAFTNRGLLPVILAMSLNPKPQKPHKKTPWWAFHGGLGQFWNRLLELVALDWLLRWWSTRRRGRGIDSGSGSSRASGLGFTVW